MSFNIPSRMKSGCREESLRSDRGAGFTLIEILIATSILTLGLVGILALFPVAIKAGSSVVESSNAVVIAQSVVDSIRSGIRNNKGLSKYQHSYFLLRHDGVEDKVPSDPKLVSPKGDYYILLPRFKAGRKFRGRSGRADSLSRGKLFIYPESDTRTPSGGGNALAADDDGDDFQKKDSDGDVQRTFRVEKVYRLGQKLIPGGDPRDANFSEEFLLEKRVLKDMTIETLRQYSFAIKVRNSYYDADASEDRSYQPANKLYHFTVLIYRGFPEKRPLRADETIEPIMKVYFEAAI